MNLQQRLVSSQAFYKTPADPKCHDGHLSANSLVHVMKRQLSNNFNILGINKILRHLIWKFDKNCMSNMHEHALTFLTTL